MKCFSLMLVPDMGQVRSYRISPRLLLSGVLLVLLLLVFGSWGAYSAYQNQHILSQLNESQNLLDMTRLRQNEERTQMQQTLASEQQKLSVYALNLGQLEARLLRLDSLGEHLVEVSSLNKKDFDFGVKPALGGPMVAMPMMGALNLDTKMEDMDQQLTYLDAQLAIIDMVLQDGRDKKLAKPHAWPTEGGWLSSHFGIRADPFTGRNAQHNGVDIANRFGAPVVAASHGIVVFSGKVKGFGYLVEVDNGYGYRTRYAHLSSVAVKAGDEVSDNQLLGRIGSTGRSTGPHLHFELRRFGKAINPEAFLPRS